MNNEIYGYIFQYIFRLQKKTEIKTIYNIFFFKFTNIFLKTKHFLKTK